MYTFCSRRQRCVQEAVPIALHSHALVSLSCRTAVPSQQGSTAVSPPTPRFPPPSQAVPRGPVRHTRAHRSYLTALATPCKAGVVVVEVVVTWCCGCWWVVRFPSGLLSAPSRGQPTNISIKGKHESFCIGFPYPGRAVRWSRCSPSQCFVEVAGGEAELNERPENSGG